MDEVQKNSAIESLLQENRYFAPSTSFKEQANVKDDSLYFLSKENSNQFWAECAEEIDWFKPWNKLLDWKPPYAQWFIDGKLNVSYNCIDRHLATKADQVALFFEGEPGDQQSITYQELHKQVCLLANALKKLGVKKGDRVAIYLPMIPEAIISMLSCARIGAIHTVIFGGFSAQALQERIADAEASVLITADGGFRRGNVVPLKATADIALQNAPSISKVIVVKRTGKPIEMHPDRDYWYQDLISDCSTDNTPEPMDAEDPLFILYTSGTTGKPKGILHTTGGYLVGVHTSTKWVFDLKPEDIYWCTADIGWITGHSYVTYGPLSNGATQVIYEGAPDWPLRDRFWKIIENYKVSIFYTAPTAIRAFMKWGRGFLTGKDLSSLRLLGSVGEPINPEAWIWYFEQVGGKKCPIVDTWWQTETGSILIAPLPGITTLKPGSATRALPGIDAAVLNEKGDEVDSGYLAIKTPWPSMLRGIYKDSKRYEESYWQKWNNQIYFTGDGARRDEEGYFWLLGRIDDVMNISGHRISTMEVESALVGHPLVAEAAVIGVTDEIKGQAIVAFVTLKERATFSETLETILKEHVVQSIGAMARPKRILFAKELPKTRSGKIMRRLLRDIGEGKLLGDVTTLADVTVLEDLRALYEEND